MYLFQASDAQRLILGAKHEKGAYKTIAFIL